LTLLERLIFQPRLARSRDVSALGWSLDEVRLRAGDGTPLHGYWLDDGPRVTRGLLFLHGNRGDATRPLPYAQRLRALGMHVLVLDYRGYGKSGGVPSEAGARLDARAALAYLAKDRGITEARTFLFGRSLGSAIAVDAAQDAPLAGVVLDAAFPSVASIARSYLGIGFEPWLGRHLASEEKIARVASPLLFLHGDRDRVIPIRLGRALFAAAPEPKAFHVVAGARHHDVHRVGGDALFERLRAFFDALAPEPRP
jgi:hypothetical protein